MIPIFIGYDPREAVVFQVCVHSLVRHARRPLAITPLALNNIGSYSELHTDGSNAFIYSRFLLPHLTGYSGWALYIDGDMLLRADIAELWALRDESCAVMCVQHDYQTRSAGKYMGSRNENYPRKNWSSVVMWNCAHPANRQLTPDFVQQSTGAQLHRFTWLQDSQIGALPITWNWLPDEFGANADAKLVHWTLGAPCFHEYADVPMAGEWHREKLLSNFCKQHVVEGPF